jgi:hypothetical protein
MKCKKCNTKVEKCKDCNNDFQSIEDICCCTTDFFGDGKSVSIRHICVKCAKEILK